MSMKDRAVTSDFTRALNLFVKLGPCAIHTMTKVVNSQNALTHLNESGYCSPKLYEYLASVQMKIMDDVEEKSAEAVADFLREMKWVRGTLTQLESAAKAIHTTRFEKSRTKFRSHF